jgi:hypothetical protein
MAPARAKAELLDLSANACTVLRMAAIDTGDLNVADADHRTEVKRRNEAAPHKSDAQPRLRQVCHAILLTLF